MRIEPTSETKTVFVKQKSLLDGVVVVVRRGLKQQEQKVD